MFANPVFITPGRLTVEICSQYTRGLMESLGNDDISLLTNLDQCECETKNARRDGLG